MNRRTERLYEQRRRLAIAPRQEQARSEIERQWRIRTERSQHVTSWWNYDVGDDVIEQGNTSSSIAYDQLTRSNGRLTTDDGAREADSGRTGGCLSRSTTNCSTAGGSWKTLMWGKSCNRARSISLEDSGDRPDDSDDRHGDSGSRHEDSDDRRVDSDSGPAGCGGDRNDGNGKHDGDAVGYDEPQRTTSGRFRGRRVTRGSGSNGDELVERLATQAECERERMRSSGWTAATARER